VKKVIAGALVLAGLGLVAWSVAVHPWGWLYAVGVHPYPLSSSTPWTYQMWSGIIPALDGCWRIGKHRVAGTPWCNHHVGNAKPSVSTEDLLLQILAELRQPR